MIEGVPDGRGWRFRRAPYRACRGKAPSPDPTGWRRSASHRGVAIGEGVLQVLDDLGLGFHAGGPSSPVPRSTGGFSCLAAARAIYITVAMCLACWPKVRAFSKAPLRGREIVGRFGHRLGQRYESRFPPSSTANCRGWRRTYRPRRAKGAEPISQGDQSSSFHRDALF